ncbi:hypothetical protein DRE_02970 [Drechslerella stenobrocha 248]|uniref:F-box domain-containing protein n=1 Tax=Drechslerella stenobrocha 248 TaxID=1043628 RepID=W7IF97_9PEZI|nr:hypothetical protein DRE_02970 [Drechslerella stenobrocha 248]
MTGLLSLPLEVIFLITGYLSADDIKSIRLTQKDLNEKTAVAHTDELFRRRTYFATIDDLRALLNFTRHPSKVNLRLKHLRLDVASPYIHIQPRPLLDSLHGEDGESAKPPKIFNQTCFAAECQNYEGVEQSEDQALIFAAFQNLPNLEVVEFVDRIGAPSEKSLKIHYPSLTTPELKDEFMEFYNDHSIRQKRSRMSSLFLYVMVALKYSSCRLRELLVDIPRHPYMFMSHAWFENHRRHVKDLKAPLRNLRFLELNLSHPAEENENYADWDESLETSEVQMKCLPSFFTDATPNIETLKLCFEEIADVYNTRSWVGKYRAYEPNLLLKGVELKLPHIKRLELRAIPFVKEELEDVLLRPHASTLRHLVLEDCVLQELPQTWSLIFGLLDGVLNLDSFSFWTKSIDGEIGLTGRMPYIFRVWGNINNDDHVCEVQVLRKKELIRTNYTDGLHMILQLENKLSTTCIFGHGLSDGGPDEEEIGSQDSDDEFDTEDDPWNGSPGDWPHFLDGDDDDEFDEDDSEVDAMDAPILPLPSIMASQNLLPMPTYSSQILNINPFQLQLPQSASLDNTGNFLGVQMLPQHFPRGSVLMPPFLIPRPYLDADALEGQPLSVQNVLRNLTSTALNTGVDPHTGISANTAGTSASTEVSNADTAIADGVPTDDTSSVHENGDGGPN